jgi:hypothetical protein
VAADATPDAGAAAGCTSSACPTPTDAAVTRHLASVPGPARQVGPIRCRAVQRRRHDPGQRCAQRVLDQVERPGSQGRRPRELPTEAPELAVALGAAYFGLVRRGLATRIRGGTARAFYVGRRARRRRRRHAQGGVLSRRQGPRRGRPGRARARDFVLVTNRPVSFKLYSSSVARATRSVTVVAVGDGRAEIVDAGGGADADTDLLELPPIVTVLRARGPGARSAGSAWSVHITRARHAVEIWPASSARPRRDAVAPERWRLAFDHASRRQRRRRRRGRADRHLHTRALDDAKRPGRRLVSW